jgi:hypothetical protein
MKIVWLILLPIILFAKNYYVQNGGNDNSAGTAIAPWAHCPGMDGWTGSATLSAGDTVYFNNSDTWSWNGFGPGGRILLVEAGVTYIGNEWPSADSDCSDGGCAKIDLTDSDPNVWFNMKDDHATHEMGVKGFEFDGNNTSCGNVIGINGRDGSYNTTDMVGAMKRVQECYIHNVRSDYSCGSSSTYAYGVDVTTGDYSTGANTKNVEILNNHFYQMYYNAIVLYPGNKQTDNWVDSVVVRGNRIIQQIGSDNDGNVNPGFVAKNWVKHFTFEYNYLYDMPTNCVSVTTHNSSQYSVDEAIIRYNILNSNDNSTNNGIIIQGPSLNNMRTFRIYGNIVMGTWFQYGIKVRNNLDDGLRIFIYNNTVINDNIMVEALTAVVDSGEIKNNISTGGIVDDDGTFIISNNNTTDNCFKDIANLPTGFMGTYNVDLAPDNDGLSITENSDCMDGGATLGAPYNSSINTVSRPQNGSYDIGAYEIPVGGPEAPKNIRIKK